MSKKSSTKEEDKLIQILATKHRLSLSEIERIVSSQFRLVEKTMSEGKFESVRLPFFGVFRAKPGRVKHIKDAKRKTAEN